MDQPSNHIAASFTNILNNLSQRPDLLQELSQSSSTAATPIATNTGTAAPRLSLGQGSIQSTSLFGSSPKPSTSNSSTALKNLMFKNKKSTPQAQKSGCLSRGQVFSRKVILCKEKDSYRPIKASEEFEWGKQKLLFEGVQFFKSMTYDEIKDVIYEKFSQRLRRSNNITLMIKSGQSLRPFFVSIESDINGEFLSKTKGNELYIQPEFDIILTDDESDDLMELSDIFPPKKKKMLPKKLPKLDSTDDIEDDGLIVVHIDGSVTYTDPSGKDFLLEDHVTPKHADISTILRKCKGKVSDARFELSVDRSNAFKQLSEGIKSSEFSLEKTPAFYFTAESGVGKGVTREVLSVAMRQIKNSPYMEGTEFSKTFKFVANGVHNGIYERIGEIVALSLLNEGPAPSFFSRVIFDMIMFDEIKGSLEVHDVLNEWTKNEILNVSNAETVKAINEKLAEASVFEAAGTALQVSGSDFKLQKETAIKDAIRYYCVDRIALPLIAFKKGLNRDVHLLSDLQQNPTGAEKLFCHQNVPLTAQDIINLFQVSEDVEKSKPYRFWKKYLGKVESGDRSVKLEDVLFFAVGVYEIPPLGFQSSTPKIVIREQLLANAKSCFNELYLPSQFSDEDEEAFFTAIDLSVENKDYLGCV